MMATVGVGPGRPFTPPAHMRDVFFVTVFGDEILCTALYREAIQKPIDRSVA
jgi:hypothetical protein